MRVLIALLAISFLVFGCASGQVTNSTNVQSQGEIVVKGSDTLLQVVSNLAEAFSNQNPNTRISVTGGGSGTGIAALINGEVQIANSSRPVKEEELQLASENGVEVLEFIIGQDSLSIIVNESNPLTQLTVEQVGQIFRGEITNWKEVGGPDLEITLYGRQTTSGTYVFFQEHVLQGDYSTSMRNMEGNQAIVDAVRSDETGIGYVGVGYISASSESKAGLTVLNIAKDASSEYISPLEYERILDYGIARPLFQYYSTASLKNQSTRDFLDFELSSVGQQIVQDSGFIKIGEAEIQKNEENLKKI